MSKWVEVVVTMVKTYAVELDDHETIDKATDYVYDCESSEYIEEINTVEWSGDPSTLINCADKVLRYD